MADYSTGIGSALGAGLFGYNKTLSGKIGVSFDYTGSGVTLPVYGKDAVSFPSGSRTAAFYLTEVWLSCGTVGQVGLKDGSTGTDILRIGCGSTGANAIYWDFKHDPLICLTADASVSLCISLAGNGMVAGRVNGFWGPIPQ